MMIMKESLDKEVKSRIEFLEDKFNCLIILNDENGKTYMNVAYFADNKIEHGIELCGVHESKYKMLTAMRKHFN